MLIEELCVINFLQYVVSSKLIVGRVFGIEQLRASIEQEVDHLDHIHDLFPHSWLDIKSIWKQCRLTTLRLKNIVKFANTTENTILSPKTLSREL
jgi:hypothetical protein